MGNGYRLAIDPEGQFQLFADGIVMHRGQLPDGMTREEFGMRFSEGESTTASGKKMVIAGHGYGERRRRSHDSIR